MREFRNIEEWRREFSQYHMESGTCLVLHTLSLFVGGVGEVFTVPVSDLAERANLSKPVVTKHLKRAQRAGWIGVRRFDATGAKLRRNDYMLKSPEMEMEGWT
ncbi:MarR family protein [Pseudovibrio sp. Ad46]|uniref:winged helix-turn-helix transcriptional regulator n=1 Tax=Pseudovibrio sp. Ad46 TaxID=989432 RepID=UPI0007AE4D9C|nr:winged helix-turn-helix transcriptional regulator [Pseudovibrio sp. Ad46]KZK80900.1 MarR family protein [Pseudovibrio sp. Ad46]